MYVSESTFAERFPTVTVGLPSFTLDPVPVQLNLERANPKLRLEAERGLQVDIPSAAELPARHPTPART